VLFRSVDLNNPASIGKSIQQTLSEFGHIDVLVNNAGYGMTGTLEETSDQDIENIFAINTMAAIYVTREVLPVMRSQQSGHIINMGSVAGFVGAPSWSVYSATKAAIAAFSEVLALDLKDFGIKVTVVEPSGFRTGFLSSNSLVYKETRIQGYGAVKNTQERYLANNGSQPGDPDKAAGILIDLSEMPKPPLHLFLGEDAYNRASEKMAGMRKELEEWKAVSISADFIEQEIGMPATQ